MPYRQQQARLTLTLDNVNLGVWDNKTGGDQDSNSTQYFLGGMGPRISLGGVQQVNNVVVQVLQDAQIEGLKKFILSRAGKGSITYNEQALDDEGFPFGEPLTWRGVLKRAKASDVNAQSADAKIFEIEIEVNGSVS